MKKYSVKSFLKLFTISLAIFLSILISVKSVRAQSISNCELLDILISSSIIPTENIPLVYGMEYFRGCAKPVTQNYKENFEIISEPQSSRFAPNQQYSVTLRLPSDNKYIVYYYLIPESKNTTDKNNTSFDTNVGGYLSGFVRPEYASSTLNMNLIISPKITPGPYRLRAYLGNIGGENENSFSVDKALAFDDGTNSIVIISPAQEVSSNGVCGSTINKCLSGVVSNISSGDKFNYWRCAGVNEGISSYCSLVKPVNGSCGSIVNTCNAGMVFGSVSINGINYWGCTGEKGGSNADCSGTNTSASNSSNNQFSAAALLGWESLLRLFGIIK